MTSPIGPLSAGYSQLASRIQDGPRTFTVPVLPGSGAAGESGEAGVSFKDTFTRAINEVSAARERGAELTERFAAGEQVELHSVMAASEEASLALDLTIEMRNKVVEAYRSLVNMQS